MTSVTAPPLAHHTIWHNISGWTSHLQAAVNLTKLAPSLEDLVLAGPRAVRKLGSLVSLYDTPDNIQTRTLTDTIKTNILQTLDNSLGFSAAASQVGMDTSSATNNAATVPQSPGTSTPGFSMEGAKGLGSVFSYATSKWALSCIAMAVVLNRTYIFAATRRRLRLAWPVRLLLRCVPLALFILQARQLLQSMQCQTSPDFADLRWGNSSKKSDLLFTQTGGMLHTLSSSLLLGATDKESCIAVNMIPPDNSDEDYELRGSLSRLWPLFGTFCLSQLLETISCAVQGRPVAAETGMTLFEHSLAFAEADAAISNQLGWGSFVQPQSQGASSNLGSAIAISRSMVLKRVNTPPEVLWMAFLSVMSHLTSHTLGLFNLQARFRLINTAFWGLCFMESIVWSALNFSFDDAASHGLLRYPTVCIIGFVPHVLVLGGIITCLSIYFMALFLSALTFPGNNLTFRQRFVHARANMQVNLSLSDIRVTREMDFYTALLRTGFSAITMASEAVYLNEDREVSLKARTWLEDERFQELEELRMQWVAASVNDSRLDPTGTVGLIPFKNDQSFSTNGYARERAAQKLSKARAGDKRLRDGIGAAERSGRWLLSIDFLMNTNKLMLRACVAGAIRILSKLGLPVPNWLRWATGRPKPSNNGRDQQNQDTVSSGRTQTVIFEGLSIPQIEGIDVESEVRKSKLRETKDRHLLDEAELDTTLYRWWLKGGWWGSDDMSSDYEAADCDADDDLTSVLSVASDEGSDDDAWESDGDGESGARTPTQKSPFTSRETTPSRDVLLPLSDLARLLSPSTREERDEARTLAAHLRNNGIMTRSRYRHLQRQQRTEILNNPGTTLSSGWGPSRNVAPEEEAELLEQLILARRRDVSQREQKSSANWTDGAPGLGDEGPQCVVCHSMPRTIIVWPCRCLSLCDDCRVSLAMNNFDKCVCCRREVLSFSRIFVP